MPINIDIELNYQAHAIDDTNVTSSTNVIELCFEFVGTCLLRGITIRKIELSN